MQHALFGKLLRFDPVTPGTALPVARLGFIHPSSTKSSTNSSSSARSGSQILETAMYDTSTQSLNKSPKSSEEDQDRNAKPTDAAQNSV